MELLGKIGIDFRLLGAQVLNFLVLLWILSKFLYKPILRKIEENEKELNAAKRLEEELHTAEERFEHQKQLELSHAHTKVQHIIEEAEEISTQLKKKQFAEYEQNKQLFLKQQASLSTTNQKEYHENLQKQIRSSLTNELLKKVKTILTASSQNELELYFFEELQKKLQTATPTVANTNITSLLDKLENLTKAELKSSTQLVGKQLEKELIGKIGNITLRYAVSFTPKQKDLLSALISKKIEGEKKLITITAEKDESLLSGYELEVGGIIIESNLREELTA